MSSIGQSSYTSLSLADVVASISTTFGDSRLDHTTHTKVALMFLSGDASKRYMGLYLLQRHGLIGVGIPIINLSWVSSVLGL